nr:integrase, catalytic region, zinc finger, CCHC-type, peptidase aspartic, catalytic [Tanacetum cinerariifolium]
GRQNSYVVGTSGTRANTSGTRGNYLGQQRVVKCFNCQGEGHMARQCPKPKRKRDATWFREKVLLVEAQGNGKVLNEEELEFLADPDILKVLMANFSSYRSDVLSEVPISDNTNNDMEKEAKNIDTEISLEKKVKELDDIVCKMGQSAQIVHMLTKPQVFYDNNLKQALGFQNPFYLKKAQQIRPMLFDGNVIVKETNVISIADSEETLMLKEESRSKMFLKQSNPVILENKVNTKPINYAELNRLSEDFGKRFALQREVSDKQALHPSTDQSASSPVKIEAPHELSKMEAAVQQYHADKQCFEIQKKQFLIENDQLLDQIISKDIVNIVVNYSVDVNTFVKVNSSVVMNDSEKVFVITALKNGLRKLKGKEITDNTTTIALEMYKLNPVILAPKVKNNREAHKYYLKHTMKQAAILRECKWEKYILVIVDDYSRFTWLKFLASKDEAPDFIIKFLKMIYVGLNEIFRNIRTDNETEFVIETLRDYYEQVGISHETSVAQTPQQNGPKLQCMTPTTPSSGLVPNPPPSASFVPQSRHE